MPDVPPPGLPPRVPVPPPGAALYEDAVRRAGRRRRRRGLQALTTSAALAAVLVGLAVLPSGDASDRLSVAEGQPAATSTPDPDDPTAPSSSPGPTSGAQPASAQPDLGRPEPEPAPSADSNASPEPRTGGGAQPEPEPREEATPRPGPPGQATPGGAAPEEVGPPSQRTALSATQRCDGSGPTPTHGWCSYYDGDLQAARGGTAELATAVCRMGGRTPGRLQFESGEQVDFNVAGRWSWRTGRRFSQEPTTLTVQPGECIRWSVTWRLQDDGGKPLPAGTYDLEALPRSDASDETRTSTYFDANHTFRITD